MRAVLVDLDGTLVDTHAANLAAYRQALGETGMAYSSVDLSSSVGKMAWRPMLKQLLPSHPDLHERIARRKREIYPTLFDRVRVNKLLVAVLQQLHKTVPIALVTAASRASVTPLLAEKKLDCLFSIVVTSDDTIASKPSPEPFIKAAALLNVGPEDCLVLEDSEVGLAAAQAFGAQTWRIHWLDE